ncbi:MAG: 5-formyltetrahydrofolate cyclo-ligase [Chitinophagaceae bacterium]
MTKKELRKIFREKRNSIPAAERVRLDDLLLIQFQQVDLPFINSLLTFRPIIENNEPNAGLFTRYLEFRNPGLLIAYPRSDFENGELVAVPTNEETIFTRNKYHIHEPAGALVTEPEEIDMVLVPLLSFDRQGYRVGYGKGFYDRFLANCRKDCIKAGFSYFPPVEQITDSSDFDVPLDLCITPQTVYVF